MRLLYYYCFVFLVCGVIAQRRGLLSPTQEQQNEPVQRVGRGRARFTQTPEYNEFVHSTDVPADRKSSRRKLDYERYLQPQTINLQPTINYKILPTPIPTSRKSGSRLYEVSETLDDVPDSRRRPKVITEQIFEAVPTKKDFIPEPIQTSSTIADTITPKNEEVSFTTQVETNPTAAPETTKLFTSEVTTSAISREPQKIKKVLETTVSQAPAVPERRPLIRTQLRSRSNTKVEETLTTEKPSRGRQSRRQQDSKSTTTIAPEILRQRASRRKPAQANTQATNTQSDISRRESLSLENEHENPTRSRSGRRTDQKSSRRSDSIEEIEYRDIGRTRRLNTASSTRAETKLPAENNQSATRGRGRTRVNSRSSGEGKQTTTISPRRGRARSFINFDEQKLEVLPLFAGEIKTERITAVDSIPNFSRRTISESTTPLQPRNSSRFPSRNAKEVKNNSLEETRSRSNRKLPNETTTKEPFKRSDRRRQSSNRETSTIKTFPSRNSGETTTESRRRNYQRVKPKRVEPTLSENKLQTLNSRRSSRRKGQISPRITPTMTSSTTERVQSTPRSSEKVAETFEEGFAETSVTSSIEKFDDTNLEDKSKRGSIKNEKEEEDSVEESDNYPAEFKALFKTKQKDTDNDIPTKSKSESTTQLTYTATAKEVKTSVSSKITVSRQRFSSRYKAKDNSKDKVKDSVKETIKTITPLSRFRGTKPKLPPKVTELYNNRNTIRSTTSAPVAIQNTTSSGRRTTPKSIVDVNSEAPNQIKPRGHRFSSRYRSNSLRGQGGLNSKSAPAYVSRVPTVTPGGHSTTTSNEENELQVLTLDGPLRKSLLSADLIRDDYLTTTESTIDERKTKDLLDLKKPVKNTKTTVNNVSNATPKTNELYDALLSAITSGPRSNARTTTIPIRQGNSNNPNEILIDFIPQRLESASQLHGEKQLTLIEQIIKSLTNNATTTTTTTTERTLDITQVPISTIQKIPKKTGHLATQEVAFGTPRSVIDSILNSISTLQDTTDENEKLVVITKPPQKEAHTTTARSSTTYSASSPVKFIQKSVTVIPPSNTIPALASTTPKTNKFTKELDDISLRKRTLSTLMSLFNIATTPIPKKEIITTPTNIENTPITLFTPAKGPTTTVLVRKGPNPSNFEGNVNIVTMPTTTDLISTTTDVIIITPESTTEFESNPSTSITEVGTTEDNIIAGEIFETLRRFAVNLESVKVSSPNDIESDFLDNTDFTTENLGTTTEGMEETVSDLPFDMISTTNIPIQEHTTTEIITTVANLNSTLDNDNKIDGNNETISQGGDNTPVVKYPPMNVSYTDKDYYLFAILPNNTVVRKRPSMYPTKETPYLIYGIFSNNTIVRKFPNGTVVPEEPLIQVRGFDTSDNLPDLITSNQVLTETTTTTRNNGPLEMDNTSTMGNESLNITMEKMPAANDATTNIIDLAKKVVTTTLRYQTLDVDPQTNQVRSNVDNDRNVVYRWKPITTSSRDDDDINLIGSASTTQTSVVSPNNIPFQDKHDAKDFSTSVKSTVIEESLGTTTKVPILKTTIPISTTIKTSLSTETTTAITPSTTMRLSTAATTKPKTTDSQWVEMLFTSTPVYNNRGSIPPGQEIITSPKISTTTVEMTTKPFETTTTARITSTTPTKETTTEKERTTEIPNWLQRFLTQIPAVIPMSVAKSTTTANPKSSSFFVTNIPITASSNPIATENTPSPVEKTTYIAPLTNKPTTTTGIPAWFNQLFNQLNQRQNTLNPSTTMEPYTSKIVTSSPEISIFKATTPETTTYPTTTIKTTTSTPLTTTTSQTTVTETTRTMNPTEASASTTAFSVSPVNVEKRFGPTSEESIIKEVTTEKVVSSTLKQLTDEHKKNLETLSALEREQAALLKQLSFLTNLIPGTRPNQKAKSNKSKSKNSASLANNLISTDDTSIPAKKTTLKPTEASTTEKTTEAPKKIDSVDDRLQNLLKQYDTNGLDIVTSEKATTARPVTEATQRSTTPGRSSDAILAQLLREQGIGPSTPRIRAFEELQSGRVPPPTQRPPGILARGLTWLANTLLPLETTVRPRTRPSSRPSYESVENFNRQPTQVTPIIYDDSTTSRPKTTKRPIVQSNAQKQDLETVLKLLQTPQTGTPRNAQEAELLRQIKEIQSNPNLLRNLETAFGRRFNLTPSTIKPVTTRRTTRTTTTTTTRRPTTRRTTQRSTTTRPKQSNINLSPEDLSYLIQQIQKVQQDPSAAKTIDISKLIGASSTTKAPTTFSNEFLAALNNRISSTSKPTRSPKYLDSSSRYNEFNNAAISSPRPPLPPVAFRPVNGVPEGEGQWRGRLVNAAVSVTRGVSRFLSNAFQDLFTGGSSTYAGGSRTS